MNLITFRTILILILDLFYLKNGQKKNNKKSDYVKLIIMITASHNHKAYNGLKIDLIKSNYLSE